MGRIKNRPVNKYFSALGRKGGIVTKRRKGGAGKPSAYYKRIGKRGGVANKRRHGA